MFVQLAEFGEFQHGLSSAVTAVTHTTLLAGCGKPWPTRRTLVSKLIRAAVVGVAAWDLMRAAPCQGRRVPPYGGQRERSRPGASASRVRSHVPDRPLPPRGRQ